MVAIFVWRSYKRKTPRLEVWGFHRVGNIDRFLKPMCMAVDVSLLDLVFQDSDLFLHKGLRQTLQQNEYNLMIKTSNVSKSLPITYKS